MSRSMTTALLAAALFSFLPLAAQAQNQAAALPEGAGKDMVEGTCTACNQANMITQSSGYTQDGWKQLISTMIDLAPLPDMRANRHPGLAARAASTVAI